MSPTRNCRTVPLSKQPLALVLIQLRYSPILNLKEYIPAIQDRFRKIGFPSVQVKNVKKLEISPSGLMPTDMWQWKFEAQDSRSSIIVDEDQILLQTTNYHSFEEFIEQYFTILQSFLAVTEHDSFGNALRIGLRYIDQVTLQSDTDTIDSYLRSPLRGMVSPFFKNMLKQYTHIEVGKTELRSGQNGTLSIRVLRNVEGLDLPSDLYQEAPLRLRKIDVKKDFALIDMDHGCEQPFPYNQAGIPVQQLEELYFGLHDTIIEVFHESVVTLEGVEKWR